MAIGKGLTVTVKINGTDATEYADDDQGDNNPNTVVKYIEAISGQPFAVHVKGSEPNSMQWDAYSCCINIDGERAVGFYLSRDQILARRHSYRDGSPVVFMGQKQVRPWLFAAINEVENDFQSLPQRPVSKLKEIGTISIIIRRCNRREDNTSHDGANHVTRDSLTLREKEINKSGSLTHSTSLGEPAPSNWTTSPCDYLDTPKSPFFRFDFKYRSRRALQSMLLIPRTPTPEPLENRDINSLNPDELRTLLTQMKSRQREDVANTQRLKREVKEEERAIRDSAAKRAKIRPFRDGEVISLLD